MAKGKHAAALFEVIQSDKRFQRKDRPNPLAPPAWFKPQNGPEQAAAAPDPANAAPATPASASAPPLPLPVLDEQPQKAPVQVQVDPDRHLIALRMTYASAIVAGFTVLVIIAVAYVLGSRGSEPVGTLLSPKTSEQVKSDLARPEVANVGPGAGQGNVPTVSSAGDDAPAQAQVTAQPPAAVAKTAPQGAAPTWNDPQPPTVTPVDDANRIIGYNYVIIQSYPEDREKDALEAKELLAANGIETTIERNVSGMRLTWHVVVGIRGFPRVKCAEYEDYIKRIERVSSQYARKGSFKAFQPFGKKWDRPSNR